MACADDARGAPGGGAMGTGGPAGSVELKDGRSRSVPIVHPARMLALVCATIPGRTLIARHDRRILRPVR
jgi:hypothetical protein